MDKKIENLVHILSSFGYRPNLVAKYLIENNLLSPVFLQTLSQGDFSTIGKNSHNFRTFQQVRDHYSDILKTMDLQVEIGELSKKLNEKLDLLIKQEKFEEAISIRDYMNEKKIPRNSSPS